jgi:CheY-like chemotaxis protein
VQLHRQLNPDVTLMDLQMPDMRGLDVVSEFWLSAMGLPALVVS